MALDGDLAVDDRQHGLQLHVKGRILARRDVIAVADRAHQQLTQHRRHSHTGHGALFVLAVAALRVFAEGALHCRRGADDHLVHALADQLDDGKRTADHVGASRAGADRRYAAAQGVAERLVHRVDGVDRAKLRRQRLDDLVVVHAFPTHRLVVKADMAVCLHAARRDQTALRVDDAGVRRCVDDRCDGGDLAVLDQKAAVLQLRPCHRLDVRVANQDLFHAPSSSLFVYNTPIGVASFHSAHGGRWPQRSAG